MEKVTIAELAKRAGVSTTSVSRYLKQENVRKDLADKIKMAIEETGFVQNTKEKAGNVLEETPKEEQVLEVVAKKKSTHKQPYHVALLSKDITIPRARNTIKALQEVLDETESIVSIFITGGSKKTEERVLASLLNQTIDGILIESCSSVAHMETLLENHKVPCIYLNDSKKDICSLAIDERAAGEILGNYLLEKRHLIVRYLGVDEKTAHAHIDGIKKVYHDKKQPVDFSCKLCDGTYLNIYERVKEIFHEKIDLLVLERDEMAIPVSKYLQEFHIAVPQNTSIISFGGHDVVQVMSPAITALVYDYNQYAKVIVETVDALITGKKIPAIPNIFHMMEGESVR